MQTTDSTQVAVKLDEGRTVLITVKDVPNREWNERNKKTRVSIGTYKIENELLGDEPPYGSKRGDGSEEDKAWRAYNRAELKLQRELATKVFALFDVKFDGNFSRTAGCSCGCSPGWILKTDRGRWLFLEATELI